MRFGDELDERSEGDGSIKDGSSICGLSNKVPVPEMKIGRKEFVGEYQRFRYFQFKILTEQSTDDSRQVFGFEYETNNPFSKYGLILHSLFY